MLKNLKIRTKLLIGFSILAVLAGAIAIIGTSQIKKLNDQDAVLYKEVTVPMGDLEQISSLYQQVRVTYRDYIIETHMEDIKELIEKRKSLSNQIAEHMNSFEKSLATEEGKKLFADFRETRKEFLAGIELMEGYVLENNKSKAEVLMHGDLKKMVDRQVSAIQALVNNKIERGKSISENNTALAMSARRLMIILLIIGILSAITLGLALGANIQKIVKSVNNQVKYLVDAAIAGKTEVRADVQKTNEEFRGILVGINNTLDAVVKPLNLAADYVQLISKGEIPARITDTYYGNFNTIKDNLNQLIDNMSTLIEEMNNMSHQHDLGDIDVTINTSKFKGAYQIMADGVNKMVNGHITVKKKAMACVAEFGNGNFEAMLEKFPGKKAFINDTIEALRNNLKSVSACFEF